MRTESCVLALKIKKQKQKIIIIFLKLYILANQFRPHVQRTHKAITIVFSLLIAKSESITRIYHNKCVFKLLFLDLFQIYFQIFLL